MVKVGQKVKVISEGKTFTGKIRNLVEKNGIYTGFFNLSIDGSKDIQFLKESTCEIEKLISINS